MRRGPAGMTLMELLVSMGLLSSLGVLVLRLLTGGIDLWTRGEEVRELSDRSATVVELVAQDLERIVGAGEGTVVEGRLLVAPFRIPEAGAGPFPGVRFLRRLRGREEAPLERPAAVPARTGAAAGLPPGGLLPAPEGEPDAAGQARELGLTFWFTLPSRNDAVEPGVYLALWRAERHGSEAEPFHRWFGPEPFGGLDDLARTAEEVHDGLLFFGVTLWSQTTREWDSPPGEGGPEAFWDSTRGGGAWTPEGPGFTLDVGPWSLRDPRDDVMPRLALIEVVIERALGEARCALLREDLGEKDKGPLWLDYPERLAGGATGGMVKIGAEWIRFQEIKGEFLHGLERGVRGTRPAAHAAGSRLHQGWSARRLIHLPQPREWWGATSPAPQERP